MTKLALGCRNVGDDLEITDSGIGSWMMRLSTTTSPATESRRVIVAGTSAVGALAQSLTPVSTLLSAATNAGTSLQVAFSPATQAAIESGALNLMSSSKGALPTAVDAAGKIKEHARVMPAAGLAAGPALLPILVPAAITVAASYFAHQALQATLDGIRKVIDRIERRHRDDDWAILEAGDALAGTLVDDNHTWDIPDQLRTELAVARQHVERVFRSRRRFTNQIIHMIEKDARGRTDPWTAKVRKLVEDDANWIEVSIYLQAMTVRARLTAATAFVLASDGDARAAATFTRSSIEELANSYEPLVHALGQLAERRPEERLRDRMPVIGSDGDKHFDFVNSLVANMKSGVGSALETVHGGTAITIPAHDVKAIQGTIGGE